MSGEPWGGAEALWFQAAQLLHKLVHAVLVSVHGCPITPAPIYTLKRPGITDCERYPIKPSRLDKLEARIISSQLDGKKENISWQRDLGF